MVKVAIFLPVKEESSRIYSKNVQFLDGKPLFLHTLEKLIYSKAFDEVWLDTDSQLIIDIADHLDCKIHRRDPALATNDTDGNKLFLNQVKQTNADIVVQILCTSPFIQVETIVNGIKILQNNPEYDSAVLIHKEKQYRWENNKPAYDINKIPNSVNLPDTILETMGLYIVRRDIALNTGRRIGNAPYLLDATPIEALDVNWPEDFTLANLVAAGLREDSRRLLNNIKLHITGAMLSDVFDELSIDPQYIISCLQPNILYGKLLGRANTLRLRAIKPDEDYSLVYMMRYLVIKQLFQVMLLL